MKLAYKLDCNYYPFGMLMPGRSYTAGSQYRFGFNGKENDNDVEGDGKFQDYGMRSYDPRLGRFISVDPLTKKYPELSTYQFASNSPIQAIDLDGTEEYHYSLIFNKQGKAELKFDNQKDIKLRVWDWRILGFKTELNPYKVFIVHTGQFHTGAINGYQYTTEILFHYYSPTEFLQQAPNLTQHDIDDEDYQSRIEDRIITGLQNIAEEYQVDRPGSGKEIPVIETRTMRNNKTKAVNFKWQNGREIDISPDRVKEMKPNSNAPNGQEEVNFKKDGLPKGSTIHPYDPKKRTPTKQEQKALRNTISN